MISSRIKKTVIENLFWKKSCEILKKKFLQNFDIFKKTCELKFLKSSQKTLTDSSEKLGKDLMPMLGMEDVDIGSSAHGHF